MVPVRVDWGQAIQGPCRSLLGYWMLPGGGEPSKAFDSVNVDLEVEIKCALTTAG